MWSRGTVDGQGASESDMCKARRVRVKGSDMKDRAA
jgi:hypothetical protein